MDMDVLEQLRDRVDHAAGQVIGTPIERDGATLVPLVSIRGGGGGGQGDDPATGAGGVGGGWGVTARPVGAFVLRGGEVSYEPALDVTRIVVGGQVVAVVALLVARGVIRARRRRVTARS